MRDTHFLSRRRSDDNLDVIGLVTYGGEVNDPSPFPSVDLVQPAQAVEATASAARGSRAVPADELLNALHHLRRLRETVDQLEPELIAAARTAGVSWQALAPAMGVASRQAAERRFLRLAPATPDQAGGTRDQRVREVRDRRAGTRAVHAWANNNTADLRRLAGQITALDDLDPESASDIARLHQALGEAGATALPGLLAQTRQHLTAHPALSAQIDAVTAHTTRIRRETQQQRDSSANTNANRARS
jgi:hypothetical protein